MKHASVFSGIGGPEVAAAMLGWENVFHCEINDFGRKILEYWFPKSTSYEDITQTDFTQWRGKVDVLTGGFPCQPFSYAGKRRGAEDDRYLWPHMFRCIDQIRPAWVVAENVAGILTMVEQGEVSSMASTADLFGESDGVRGYRLRETFTLQRICDDLERHGYSVQPILVPACAVGAPHRRDRVFIIGRRRDGNDADNAQDPVCGGQLVGRDGEQGSERNERNAGARGGQRICAETSRTDSANANGAGQSAPDGQGGRERQTMDGERESIALDGIKRFGWLWSIADTKSQQSERLRPQQSEDSGTESREFGGISGADGNLAGCGRWQGFPTVSPVHRGNDGLPFDVDDLTIPFSKWRTESLKAYGNAIVPQVMYEIFRAIEIIENELK